MTDLPALLQGRHLLVCGTRAAAGIVADRCAALGAVVTRSQSDQVDVDGIARTFADAEASAGSPVDLLVHAGTPLSDGAAQSVTLDAWRDAFSADLDGRFLHVAEFARRRIAAHAPGAILFLMPSAAIAQGRSAALTAHGALDNLVKSLAAEWGRDAIRINAIASRVCEEAAATTDTQRESLANLSAYLLCDHAAYITGMTMGIDELG